VVVSQVYWIRILKRSEHSVKMTMLSVSISLVLYSGARLIDPGGIDVVVMAR